VFGGIKTIVVAVRGLMTCVGCVLVRVGTASFLALRKQLLGDLFFGSCFFLLFHT